ncbi:hypothetical protein GCM10007392_05900 [Saccharospirillum salsuginis]|uniref:N-acylglucosamine-6-phosphate 2-epimerase n=1 Tax=Saccharospirillum salsuginis TaxID=418750 RepID=A0A918K2Q0_9GAMM|nr:hypothetical protein GCM10007392_05900 [Saccharospirillum salsuginis]
MRIEGAERVAAVAAVTHKPLVGIVKRDLEDSPVRITPYLEDVDSLADAGATIIAFDATDRIRPVPAKEVLARIHERGCMAMADCSTFEEGAEMVQAGCDLIASTLSGYVDGPVPNEPDFQLVKRWSDKGWLVVAEGRIRTAQDAHEAIKAGALAVTVGSAITRPDDVTGWFLSAMNKVNESALEGREPQ